MKIIAQPESYSDMLERIFATTLVTGIMCTLILAGSSPAVKALLDSVKTEAEIGPVKNLKALYVLLPIAIAVISRALRLHDRISDILRIRFDFDTQYILFPMAHLTGHELDRNMRGLIRSARQEAMYKVFYPYAGFADPKIDKQLVRSALDNWGWFWVCIESGFLFSVTAVIVKVLHRDTQFRICLVILLVIAIMLLVQWFACRRSAGRQVRAIVDDEGRKSDIRAYFAGMMASPNKW